MHSFLFLHLSKAAGWNHYLVLQVWTPSAKILMLVIATTPPSPLTLAHHHRLPVIGAFRLPCKLMMWDNSRGLWRVLKGLGWPLFFSPTGRKKGSRETSLQVYCLCEGQCDQHITASLILPMQSVVQGGVYTPPSCSRIFSAMPSSWISIN